MAIVLIIGILVLGALGLMAALLAYGAKRKRAQNALYLRLYAQPAAADGPCLPLFPLMKGARILAPIAPTFRLFGISEKEYRYILPILAYFEGCVYARDLVAEAHYQPGTTASGDQTWAESMVRAAQSFKILDDALRTDLDALTDYFTREGALMRGEEPLTERALLEVTQARSYDLLFLFRAGLSLLGRPISEPMYAAMRPWLALGEIRDDLRSYERDVRDNSFNTLRLLVRLHGEERAVQALDAMRKVLMRQGIESLHALHRRQVARLVGLFMERDFGIPMAVFGPLAVVPKRIVIAGFERSLRRRFSRAYGVIPTPIAEPAKN